MKSTIFDLILQHKLVPQLEAEFAQAWKQVAHALPVNFDLQDRITNQLQFEVKTAVAMNLLTRLGYGYVTVRGFEAFENKQA